MADVPTLSTEEWFEALYMRKYAPLVRQLWSLCNSYNSTLKQDMEEVAQDTFSLLWAKRERMRHHPNVEGWLYVTAAHKFFDLLRKAGTRSRAHAGSLNDDTKPPLDVPTEDAASRVLDDCMADIIDCIGQEGYDLLLQYYDPGVSNEELAARMGISPAALRKRIMRILQPLKARNFIVFLILMRHIYPR